MIGLLPLIRQVCRQTYITSQNLAKQKILFLRTTRAKSTRPFEVDPRVKQDVHVYSNYTSDSFYRMLTICGVVQWSCLTYLAITAYHLRDEPVEEQQKRIGQLDDGSNLSWFAQKLTNAAEGKYKNGVSFLCFVLGTGFLIITIIYPLRSVRNLWLLQGGREVQIETQTWFGRGGKVQTALENISCLQAREGPGAYIPMKVKGKHLFFLLDKNGTFHNTELFDYSIGLMRNLK